MRSNIPRRAGRCRSSGQVRPEQVVICVSDEGPGIATGDIPHVFDRFYRATEAAQTTKGAGWGCTWREPWSKRMAGRSGSIQSAGRARICFSLAA